MKKPVLIILGAVLLFSSCEGEDIVPVETTMEEVVAEPLDGGGGGGSNTFTSTVEGADFVEGVYYIDTDMTGVVRLLAVDESGYNGIEIWFPIFTMTEGDHALTYPATAGYGFTCFKDGFSAFHPSSDPGNKITITTYDSDLQRIEGSFDLRMKEEGSAVFLDNVEGEFGISY